MSLREVIIFTLTLTSASAWLSVQEYPKWPDDAVEGNDDNPLVITCRVNSSYDVQVTWFKDGARLKNDACNVTRPGQCESFRTYYKISIPAISDTGNYNCSAVNKIGERDSLTDRLIIYRRNPGLPPAKIVRVEWPLQGVTMGEDANLTCVVNAGADDFGLTFKWTRNGVALDDDMHKHEGNPTNDADFTYLQLLIRNITEDDLGNYTCHAANARGSDNRTIKLSLRDDPHDDSTKTFLTILLPVGAVLVLVVVFGGMYRRARKQRDGVENLPWTDHDNYDVSDHPIEYDIFISYSGLDRTWVKDILLKNLEREGYRVCIDFKSFMPGAPVVENIIEAIYKSRKTIFVMSKNFLKSIWAKFELEHVQHKLITMKDDSLLLIKFDDCKIPTKLLGKTFLDWTDSSVKPHFWDRLFLTLGEEKIKPDDLPPMLGLDPDRPSSFEEALQEMERREREAAITNNEREVLLQSGPSDSAIYGSSNEENPVFISPLNELV